jgi:hypothetical protein
MYETSSSYLTESEIAKIISFSQHKLTDPEYTNSNDQYHIAHIKIKPGKEFESVVNIHHIKKVQQYQKKWQSKLQQCNSFIGQTETVKLSITAVLPQKTESFHVTAHYMFYCVPHAQVSLKIYKNTVHHQQSTLSAQHQLQKSCVNGTSSQAYTESLSH